MNTYQASATPVFHQQLGTVDVPEGAHQAPDNLSPGRPPAFAMEEVPCVPNFILAQPQTSDGPAPESSIRGSAATTAAASKVTVVPIGWILEGLMLAQGSMQVSGQFSGNIQLESASADLEVLEGGKVVGNIKAPSVSIKGEFEGEINAAGGSVQIERTAKVSGKVAYSRIRMDGGCHNFELTYIQPEREAA